MFTRKINCKYKNLNYYSILFLVKTLRKDFNFNLTNANRFKLLEYYLTSKESYSNITNIEFIINTSFNESVMPRFFKNIINLYNRNISEIISILYLGEPISNDIPKNNISNKYYGILLTDL